jgi:hypothetical protein
VQKNYIFYLFIDTIKLSNTFLLDIFFMLCFLLLFILHLHIKLFLHTHLTGFLLVLLIFLFVFFLLDIFPFLLPLNIDDIYIHLEKNILLIYFFIVLIISCLLIVSQMHILSSYILRHLIIFYNYLGHFYYNFLLN